MYWILYYRNDVFIYKYLCITADLPRQGCQGVGSVDTFPAKKMVWPGY